MTQNRAVELRTRGEVREIVHRECGEELDGQEREAIADLIVESCEQVTIRGESAAAGAFELVVAETRWIIHDRDIDVVKAVRDGLLAGAALFLMKGAPASPDRAGVAIATIVFAMGELCYRILRRGATVSGKELAILLALRAASTGLHEGELSGRLVARGGREAWTPEKVRASLERLQKVVLADGTLTSFVVQDGRLVWHASDV